MKYPNPKAFTAMDRERRIAIARVKIWEAVQDVAHEDKVALLEEISALHRMAQNEAMKAPEPVVEKKEEVVLNDVMRDRPA